jgi:hypothetical protein
VTFTAFYQDIPALSIWWLSPFSPSERETVRAGPRNFINPRSLTDYLCGAGYLLALGGSALTRPVWRHRGKWLDRDMIREATTRVPTQRVVFDIEDATPAWPSTARDPRPGGCSRPHRAVPRARAVASR